MPLKRKSLSSNLARYPIKATSRPLSGHFDLSVFSFECLAMSYFHMASATLSSALSVFTSEFGMDQVGPTCYSHQANWLDCYNHRLLSRCGVATGISALVMYYSYTPKANTSSRLAATQNTRLSGYMLKNQSSSLILSLNSVIKFSRIYYIKHFFISYHTSKLF